MSYDFYKILHLSLICLLILSLGGLALFYSYQSPGQIIDKGFKKLLLGLHGISLFVIFVAGFGLIAKLKIPFPWPSWIYIKMGVWLVLALSPVLLRKNFFIKKSLSPKTKLSIYFMFLFILLFINVLAANLKY